MTNKRKKPLPIAPPADMNYGWFLEGDRIAVLRVESDEKSAGGIIIPDTAKEKNHMGWIAQIGLEVNHDGITGEPNRKEKILPGYFIVFGKYAGSEVEGDDGREYSVMRPSDIISYKIPGENGIS